MKTNKTFVCPVCGGTVSADAKACPDCGADERTGWSDRTYLDGIDVGDEIDYEALVQSEFPTSSPRPKIRFNVMAIIGAIVLVAFILGAIKILW
jgi:hypothetical protein